VSGLPPLPKSPCDLLLEPIEPLENLVENLVNDVVVHVTVAVCEHITKSDCLD
jgi:hypothetical protein